MGAVKPYFKGRAFTLPAHPGGRRDPV